MNCGIIVVAIRTEAKASHAIAIAVLVKTRIPIDKKGETLRANIH